MAENHSFEKIESPLEQIFKGRFHQMAAVRRKMGLDMRHLDGPPHQTEGKGTRRMDQFFRDIGTEKTNGITILGKMGSDFLVSLRSNDFEFF